MDVPIGRPILTNQTRKFNSLNPCFNGCANRPFTMIITTAKNAKVLILVLMDVPIGPHFSPNLNGQYINVLILVLMDVPIGRRHR